MRRIYTRPARRSSTRSRIWAAFVIFMLLASVIPALSTPVVAQDATDQTQDQQIQDPNAQPTEDPNAQPTEDTSQQDGQDQQITDQQVEPGSIAVSYRVCPPGTDLTAPDPTVISGTCTGGENGIPFDLMHTSGFHAVWNTGDAGQSAVFFDAVPPGDVTLTRVADPVAGMAVFCQGNTQFGNTKPYAQRALAPVQTYVGINLEVLEGEQIQCDWYVAPEAQGDVTVIIRKHACPDGYDATNLDMYDMAATCHETPPVVNFSVFEYGGGGFDGGIQATSGPLNSVQWDNVPNVKLTLYEELQPGFGQPVVFCGVDDQLGNDVSPTAYRPYEGGVNTIPIDAPGAGNVIQCDWYNLTGGTVYINKHACPEGYDASQHDMYDMAANCHENAGVVNMTVVSGAFNQTQPTSNAGINDATFQYVPSGTVKISETIPQQYGAPVVFCKVEDSLGNDVSPTAYKPLENGNTVSMPLQGNQLIFCDWYNVPPYDYENSVTVYKWDCPEGTQYGESQEYYGTECATEHLNIPITLTDGNGPHATTTQANGTEWDNVVPDQQGKITIAEQLPTGYGDPVVFCGTLDEDTQTLVTSTGGSITLTPASQPFTYQCNWYNLPGEGSITVYKWDCVPGTEYRTDLEYYQGGLPDQETGPCETEHLNVPIALIDGNGERATTTQANGTEWDNVVLDAQGQFQVVETIPDGYGDPVVFCGTLDDETQTLVNSTGGTILITPASASFTYQCNWYNIPYQESTVTIRKWECPQGMEIESTADAHQSACTQPMDGVEFSLTDSKGPRSLTTTGGQVQWTDVATGPVTITETVPSGYYPNPYVVCGWTAYYNGAVIDAFPQPVETVNGVLNTSISYPGTSFFCDWYNQYAGPGEVTIYKWTCPEGYDPYAWNANPKTDCTEATNGITFVLDQPADVDLQTNTGDSINGAVYFGGLTPGDYTVHEMVPDGIDLVFVLDCVGLNTGSVHPVPLSIGPSLEMKIAGGDKITCDWYNVPAKDPQYGWMTVTKYACTTATYVKDVDCEVFEGGQQFTLQSWNGSAWVNVANGTTNGAGQLTWTNLNPGTYRVMETGKTPCAIKADRMSADNNLAVQANAGTNVKVYNCGQAPTPGGKMPTKYPNTGVPPAGSTTSVPFGALLGALGLGGATTLSRRAFLRRSIGTAAVLGGGSLAVTSVLANQPIVPIEPDGTPEGSPEGTPSGTPAAECLYPATPAATPEGGLPGTPVACARGAVPTHLTIDVIGVDADVEILEIVQGEMQQPTGAEDVAWYKESARLGERGNVLIAGHLNFWGVPEGVFFLLETLRAGDRVEIEGDDKQTYRYVVQWTQDFPSDEEPPEEALTMITCGGEWNAGRAEYDHRTLVRAVRDTGAPVATPESTPQI